MATRPMERFIQEAHSSFAGGRVACCYVPVYAVHGDLDAAVPVEQSRHAVQLLQRWGYDVRYREVPGLGHEDLKMRDDIAHWLLTQRARCGAARGAAAVIRPGVARARIGSRVEGLGKPHFAMIEARATNFSATAPCG